ncbi:23S rRNA pseudouridine(2604) synthase RluF [Paenibacillus agricola]|uniref:Pseudouridine synthase n=1 Tax=Paenibacillus agricola TaxID=2716264 RepID=A0ABX0JCS2_9BACL|nr:23S rRNA pseudouridine(2604) synthase RluF [Paenibacillus agricola]NHN32019.1 23S rRNA pseudouridine(2604) synthase RluF [Paenibacillus agricola]
MRINKFISETGFSSRRGVDKLIEAQRVTINGKLAELGSKVEEGDEVCVDGQPVLAKKPPVYIALNKPVGITSTTELHIEGNIVDFVGHTERIFPIGRLDKDSEGLILLTNDGDIVNKILRAENGHDKEYIVTVDKPITPMFLQAMASGVRILGTMTNPCAIFPLENRGFRIILKQGLNRQIRRMCAALGYEVRKLKRIRIMNIRLEGLGVGQWRDLTKQEMDELLLSIAHDRK